jgi:hypothetical protein
VHFEALQTVGGKFLLDEIDPDLVIVNEYQLFKNPHAARTRRVQHFWRGHSGCVFVCLTGTPMKRSILDFAHVARWCLGPRTFLPLVHDRLTEWADALDERLGMYERTEPGCL